MWKTWDPVVGDTLKLFLDYDAYDNYVSSDLYDGYQALMQRVSKQYGNAVYDTTLNARPAYVKVYGFPGNYAYTFALSRNV